MWKNQIIRKYSSSVDKIIIPDILQITQSEKNAAKPRRSMMKLAVSLSLVAAITLFSCFGGLLYLSQSRSTTGHRPGNDLFTLVAYAADNTKVGGAKEGENHEVSLETNKTVTFESTKSSNSLSLGIFKFVEDTDGTPKVSEAYCMTNFGFKCIGDQIAKVKFTTTDGVFCERKEITPGVETIKNNSQTIDLKIDEKGKQEHYTFLPIGPKQVVDFSEKDAPEKLLYLQYKINVSVSDKNITFGDDANQKILVEVEFKDGQKASKTLELNMQNSNCFTATVK